MDAENKAVVPKYIAVILYKSSSDLPDYTPLYEESIVLIAADSLEEAREKAQVRGRREETSYRNENGDTILWSLKQVIDVNSLLDEELTDGAELYARHFSNLQAYRQLEPLFED